MFYNLVLQYLNEESYARAKLEKDVDTTIISLFFFY
jgi:hypothetical protein